MSREACCQPDRDNELRSLVHYKRPKLVVLDEPNSNLDQNGEAALNAAISTLKESGSTVVIVTHRKNVVPLADYML